MNVWHCITTRANGVVIRTILHTVLSVSLILTMCMAAIGCGSNQNNGDTFQFGITGYEALDDGGFPVLHVTFTNASGLTLTFLDGNGTELTGGGGYFPPGFTETRVALGRFGKTPSGGNYSVIVSKDPLGEIVTAEPMEFEGPKTAIDDVEVSWASSPPDYRLTDMTFNVRNDGDMPAYVYSFTLVIGNTEATRDGFREAVLPGETKTIHTSMLDVGAIKAGPYTAYLEVKDSVNAVVALRSFTLNPDVTEQADPQPGE